MNTDGKEYLCGYGDALAHAAVYVEDHCVDGAMHAKTIINMKRPNAAPTKRGNKTMNKKELEQFVAEFDAQLCINVERKGAPWRSEDVSDALYGLGAIQINDGRHVFVDTRGHVRFSAICNAAAIPDKVSRITFLLDVPCVQPEDEAFTGMNICAHELVEQLGGAIVDDDGKPLSPQEIAEIGEQVKLFYARMEAAGIPAGSPEALRLFGNRRAAADNPRWRGLFTGRYTLWNLLFAFMTGMNLIVSVLVIAAGKDSVISLIVFTVLCAAFALWPNRGGKPT